MIVTVPPHVEKRLRERAEKYAGYHPEGLAPLLFRLMIDAWSEGVTHAWTMQDIEESSK